MAVEEKLRNGDNLLNKAGNDKQQCGFALMAYHGALEDFFREELGSAVSNFKQENNKHRAGWVDLVNLWEEQRGILYQQKNTILSKNAIRQNTAHGDFVEVERHITEQYARFVKDFIRENSTHPAKFKIPSFHPPPKPAPAPKPVRSPLPPKPAPPPVQSRSPQPIPTVQPQPKAKWSYRRRLAIVFIALLVAACWPFLSSAEMLNRLISSIQESSEKLQTEAEELAPIFEIDPTPTDKPETAVPFTPSPNSKVPPGKTRIQSLGTSNVRSDPDVNSQVVGYAYHEEEFDVLETNADETWYKIRLENGTEGWIGSSRVKVLSP